jgi:hypothetical protein
MTRRFYQRCLLWVLPLLVVNSLVPVGFMLTAGKQGIELAFCPVQSAAIVEVLGQRAAASAADHSAHGAHHASGDREPAVAAQLDEHSQHARSGSCPFALAGLPILVAAAPLVQVAFVHIVRSRPVELATPSGVISIQLNRIRGPPQHV